MIDKNIIAIIFGFLPGIIWLIYFYRKDAIEPEPLKKIIKAFILGILSAIPVVIIGIIPYSFISKIFGNTEIISAVLVAPIIEETIKFATVYIFFYRDPEFDEPMDGIIYAITVALGFASIENAGYVYKSFNEGNTEITIILRSLLSVPGHALFASIYGFAMGVKKFKMDENNIYHTSLLIAMGAHAAFNFTVTIGGLGIGYLTIFLMSSLWAKLAKNIQFSLKNSPHLNN